MRKEYDFETMKRSQKLNKRSQKENTMKPKDELEEMLQKLAFEIYESTAMNKLSAYADHCITKTKLAIEKWAKEKYGSR